MNRCHFCGGEKTPDGAEDHHPSCVHLPVPPQGKRYFIQVRSIEEVVGAKEKAEEPESEPV